ncbi:hypothetical protein [Cupriavidus basilensis]|uniref:hypothetical protein n=1 Tax=Cupriavidus basilensis TaxID=68895 RepID=UPI0020A6471C|nr:hypothetical protein [Cupriavidus basilensis]MCP3017420.1 hypothetical protein [Cupriavidus basilensis]
MKCKYIVMALSKDGHPAESIFLFPNHVDHDRMAEALEAIRFGSRHNWRRDYRDGEVISAGFVNGHGCYGRSETLDKDSRPVADTKLLRQLLER